MWWMLAVWGAEVSEEVVVWARPFARFDDQRWLVRTEVITPSRLRFGTPTHTLRANAWQLEAVVHCRLDGSTGKLREADCTVESAALRVHKPRAKAADEQAIDAMAAALVGTNVQLQANHKGSIPNLDLDGLREDNLEQRELAVSARALMTQLSAAFHMEIPTANPVGASWVSYRDPLLKIAAPWSGLAAVEVAHRIDAVDGNWIEQVQGRGTSTTQMPNPKAGLPCFDCGQKLVEPDFLSQEYLYSTELSGVTVIDPVRGFPTERVWSVKGSPTAGSAGSMSSTSYWSAGVLRALDPKEQAELGNSGLVGPMGKVVPGQRLWVSVTQ